MNLLKATKENYAIATVSYFKKQLSSSSINKSTRNIQKGFHNIQQHTISQDTYEDISNANDKKTKPYQTHAGNSWIIALLLCIFFGIIGAHRFYLGYTGIGIIQLLTFGFLGIWTLIDFIRILTGSLKPKDGDYFDY